MKVVDSPSVRGIAHRKMRFYLTNPAPCPYLPGKVERKVFTNLAVRDADLLHDALTHSGFRRSQTIAYRPSCNSCSACRATRVDVNNFEPSKRWRRVLKKNQSIVRTPRPPAATREHFKLLKSYLLSRHEGGGMSDMTLREFATMVEGTPTSSVVFEYRDGSEDDAPLVAAAIADVLRDGLSMVYSFFDPERASDSLGNYIILDHIAHAKELGLDFVYLGYWVQNSQKMDYKAQFRPLQVLHDEEWQPIEVVERKLGIERS